MADDKAQTGVNAPIAPSASDIEADAIQFAFRASHVAYWVWDIETGHVFLSDGGLEMLQLSKAEFSNSLPSFHALIHPDDYDNFEKSLAEHITSNEFFRLELRMRRRDGSYAWVNIDGQANTKDANSPSRVGGSIVDVSTNVDLKQQLKMEQRTLRLIFDNVPARIWFKDSHNRILRLNETAAESMNMRVEDVEGADTYDLFPEFAKKYHIDDLAVINSGKPLLGIVEEYTPVDAPRGWVRTDKLPFSHPVTNEKHVLVIATDITQQKEYEMKILDHARRLDQANRDLDHFAYMASHDLRAPLRGMDQIARWIGEDLGEDITPDIQENLDFLRGRVRRMETLLTDILAFSRAGKNMAKVEDVDTGQIVDEITQWLSPLGGFKIVKDTDLPTLSLPKSAIHHIFFNLISNGIKHHDKSEGTVNIGYSETQYLHNFYIADDGPGIAKQYQDHVFEVFKKLKRRDDVEGSGIGLSIVKKMAEALGGAINIQSEDGQRGTRFTVSIPKNARRLSQDRRQQDRRLPPAREHGSDL
jgi:PAS domain S-box-containing protein